MPTEEKTTIFYISVRNLGSPKGEQPCGMQKEELK